MGSLLMYTRMSMTDEVAASWKSASLRSQPATRLACASASACRSPRSRLSDSSRLVFSEKKARSAFASAVLSSCGDTGEMQGRYGEMLGRCRGDVGEM